MPDGSFSDDLRHAATPVWSAQHDHPFVRGIADGTLDPRRFQYYVRQDYVFLVEYGRALALACARAPRLDWMAQFAELARSTLHDEMELHRTYAESWGISRASLEGEPAGPTVRAYTDFLLRTGTMGEFGELIAALLPCMWGYSELGQALAARERSHDERYTQWIAMYASEEFAQLARWCRRVCDDLAADASPSLKQRMKDAFLTSSRHELAFWEAAWQSER